MVLTYNDYQRLVALADFSSFKTRSPGFVGQFLKKINAAEQIDQDKIMTTVVTMNSRVLLREVSTHRQAEVTICYPQDADSIEGRVSIFTPIGIELLGRREGEIVSWKTPGGIGEFEIAKIMYQPEAMGHFHL